MTEQNTSLPPAPAVADACDVVQNPARAALDALIAERRLMPFARGTNDCCMFAADAVLAMTGRDLAADWRGTYSDDRGALRLIQQLGGLAEIGAMAGDPIPPLCADVGDVGLVEVEGVEALAVCVGAVWLAPMAQGLGAARLEDARMAWRPRHG